VRLSVNRRGVTRTVVLTRRYAIKVPSLRGGSLGGRSPRGVMRSIVWGIDANLSEIEWSTSPGVCPVLWSWCGLVNVYRRCEPVTHEPTEAEYDAIGLLHDGDRKPENLGWLDGRLVWVDYAGDARMRAALN